MACELSQAIIMYRKKDTAYFYAMSWQGLKGSNPRPTVLETAALPAELSPYINSSKVVDRQGLEPRADRL